MMEYTWWVFLHIAGVFGFLIAHGVSVGVAFRLRRERDPKRIMALLDLSNSSITLLYVSLLLLIGGGVVAGFVGDWWGDGWIWVSLGTLIVTIVAEAMMMLQVVVGVILVSSDEFVAARLACQALAE
jgi:hypothetical protein